MAEDDDVPELALPTKKKTKKKTAAAEPAEAPAVAAEEAPAAADDGDDVVALDLPAVRKKKKGKKAATTEGGDGGETSAAAAPNAEYYEYDFLLSRVYAALRRDNPDADGTKGINVEAPALVRVGTKRTGWVNFKSICDQMSRPTDHVLAFVLAELGTTGSFAANNRLTVKGRFQQKHIENVMRHYISTYVLCANCKASTTHLIKENRLQFIECDACHSRRSVATISSGFQAQVGRRKKA
eukprot:a841267_1438.p1 GENE.a841267_1438~~a841267_1438.p1  ORF type:complete len:255 (+),score=85.72 a841267_1438:46-765(+)